jgi:hypothetical protein
LADEGKQDADLIILGMPFVLKEFYATVNNVLTLPDERSGEPSLPPG